MKCCTSTVLLISFIISVILLIVSFVLAFKILPDVLEDEINKAVRLENGTEQFDRFEELPFPVSFNAHIFNVTNPEEILNGAKPVLTEIGPFMYKQHRAKTIVDTNKDEDTIIYYQNELFEFDSASTYKDDTEVTIVNAPLISLLELSEFIPFIPAFAYSCVRETFAEHQRGFFIKGTVKEILFDGVKFCERNVNGLCSFLNTLICSIASTKRNIDENGDNSLRFSFLNYKNNTNDGLYEVNRGIKDISKLGHIIRWNNATYTNFFGANTTCSEVKGTDSTLYPPRVNKEESFYIYATDICRFVEITYVRESSYKGVTGYEFGTNATTLRSSQSNPAEDCYCVNATKDINGETTCFLDGAIDMQTCFGVPVVLSFPHFLWADKKYGEGVIGLKPDESKHKTFLLVEPNTGTPLQGMKRIQINGVLRPIVGVNDLVNVNRVLLPLVWIEEGVELTDKYIDELNTSYFDKVILVDGLRWGFIALFAVLSIVLGGFWIRMRFIQKQNG